jgi:transposase
MADSGRVVIGMDPHKRTVTVEVMAADETVLGGGRFSTDVAGFEALFAYAGQWPDRVWAVEGCAGIGKHVVLRLLDAGEQVVDVPAKLSARMRVYATGQGRKTDDTDAHSIALVGVRMAGLRQGRQRRDARGASAAGRSPPTHRRGPHPNGLPAPPDPAGADSRWRQA